jgi:hypothetical protein
VRTVTWEQANARRLAHHGLAAPFASDTTVAEVAAAVSGVHAQILSAAEVSAAVRVEGRRGPTSAGRCGRSSRS